MTYRYAEAWRYKGKTALCWQFGFRYPCREPFWKHQRSLKMAFRSPRTLNSWSETRGFKRDRIRNNRDNRIYHAREKFLRREPNGK